MLRELKALRCVMAPALACRHFAVVVGGNDFDQALKTLKADRHIIAKIDQHGQARELAGIGTQLNGRSGLQLSAIIGRAVGQKVHVRQAPERGIQLAQHRF